jgi:hypothetical protein
VSHWTLDDGVGLVAADSVAGNDGRLQGDALWAEGFLGGAVLLDGNGDYIDCGNQPAYNVTDAVTLAAWVQPRGDFAYPDWSGIIMRGGANIDTFALYYNGTSKQLGFKTTGTTPNWYATGANSNAVLFDGEWHHVAATYDGKTKVVYLDAVAVGSIAATGKIETSSGRLLLGAGRDLTPTTHHLAGRLDEARLYNRALPAKDIKEFVPPKVQARKPDPADGANAVTMALLRWAPGDTAVLHDVYLGTSPELGAADLVADHINGLAYFHQSGLEPGVRYFWRVDEIEADGQTIHTGVVWSFTMQALTAYLPAPADGATDVSPAPALTWLSGLGAFKHHVYFSADVNAVAQGTADADKGLLTDPNFTPGVLEPLTTWYWRVDEIQPPDVVQPGRVWSFMTYLLVDDFESYNDEENTGTRIYETWLDGWADNSSGSTVGHTLPPFAEQAIIHGGRQSMPMDYNNVNAPNFSKAERTFQPTVDWTVNGADKLVLYVRGKTTNAPATLYLSITDAAGKNAWPEPNDQTMVTTPRWNEWRIPIELFTVLGVDMTQVKKLTIGVYNQPGQGGTGTLYFDDIYVIKSQP